MSEESTITTKGQITIPARIREKFNLTAGKKIIFIETDEGVVIKPLLHSMRSLRGILKTSSSSNDLQKVISKIRSNWKIDDE